MITRDEVLHVARLARLRLDESELEAMSAELSSVLDHIDRIKTLDLEGVEPTTHVVDLTNSLRKDVPHASLPTEVALAPAPDATADGFRVPSPQADADE